MNNVDIAIQKVRQLQQMLFDSKLSTDDLFKFTNDVIQSMEKASVEIKTNYETISKQLTEEMNTGKKQ